MFFSSLGARHQAIGEAGRVFDPIRQPADLLRELGTHFEILADRIRTVSEPLHAKGEFHLASRARYSLGEIVAAYRFLDIKARSVCRRPGSCDTMRRRLNCCLSTLAQSDKDESSMTRCADCPISPTLFHWEPQNSTSANARAGRGYVLQRRQGTIVILLVRERKRDCRGQSAPCLSPGRAHYRSHESERPMRILWELERPRPGGCARPGRRLQAEDQRRGICRSAARPHARCGAGSGGR